MIGDHKLIIFDIISQTPKIPPSFKRNWQNYSKDKLLLALSNSNLVFEAHQVLGYWNKFKQIIKPIVDGLVTMKPFFNNCSSNSVKPTTAIKRKLNLRKRLLKSLKNHASNELRDYFNNAKVEIKNNFLSKKSSSVVLSDVELSLAIENFFGVL